MNIKSIRTKSVIYDANVQKWAVSFEYNSSYLLNI